MRTATLLNFTCRKHTANVTPYGDKLVRGAPAPQTLAEKPTRLGVESRGMAWPGLFLAKLHKLWSLLCTSSTRERQPELPCKCLASAGSCVLHQIGCLLKAQRNLRPGLLRASSDFQLNSGRRQLLPLASRCTGSTHHRTRAAEQILIRPERASSWRLWGLRHPLQAPIIPCRTPASRALDAK